MASARFLAVSAFFQISPSQKATKLSKENSVNYTFLIRTSTTSLKSHPFFSIYLSFLSLSLKLLKFSYGKQPQCSSELGLLLPRKGKKNVLFRTI